MTGKDFQETAGPRPTLVLLGADAVYVGPGLDLTPHRIAVATAAIALEAPFELALPENEPHRSMAVAIIPARTTHHLRARGPMAFVYADALSDGHADLTGSHQALARIARGIGETDLGEDEVRALSRDLLSALGVTQRPSSAPHIEAARSFADRHPLDVERARDAAAIAGLATQAFQRRVRKETGMTYGQHRMRARVNAVIRYLAAGRSLTSAAHETGFSSSAHLSATVRRMFGISPSTLLRVGVRIVTDAAPQLPPHRIAAAHR